jgi:hypothetical protein
MHARLAVQDETGRSAILLTYILGVAVGVLIAVVL